MDRTSVSGAEDVGSIPAGSTILVTVELEVYFVINLLIELLHNEANEE